jgi:hypothetical protein
MTVKDLERAKELDLLATPGPWELFAGSVIEAQAAYDTNVLEIISNGDHQLNRLNDLAFAAESRALLPKLVAEIEQLQKECELLKSLLER